MDKRYRFVLPALAMALVMLGASLVPARAQTQPADFVLELALLPEGEVISFDPMLLYLAVPYGEGAISGSGFVEVNLPPYTTQFELNTQGQFLGFASGEIGGEISGTYYHADGIDFANSLLEGSLAECYETRAYLQETFNDPSYPFDCSSQEAAMENNYVENSSDYTSQIDGYWRGILNEDGTGSGVWEFTVQGLSAKNGYEYTTKTFSGPVELTSSSFYQAFVNILEVEDQPQPAEEESPPLEEAPLIEDEEPGEENLPWEEDPSDMPLEPEDSAVGAPGEQLPPNTRPLMWGSALVGVITGSAMAYVLSLLSPGRQSSVYYPSQRPDPGNATVVEDKGGVRVVGAVLPYLQGPPSSPPGPGQKIGFSDPFDASAAGSPFGSGPETLGGGSNIDDWGLPPEGGATGDDPPGSISEEEVWRDLGRDFYSQEPEPSPPERLDDNGPSTTTGSIPPPETL